ncbi:hypothetical protein EON67_12560 [archaeon]|nr:MAG: hypothetical protein EON67_12560 [archaeon]
MRARLWMRASSCSAARCKQVGCMHPGCTKAATNEIVPPTLRADVHPLLTGYAELRGNNPRTYVFPMLLPTHLRA